SLLMLAVVSAVVAFDRWPNGNVSTRVQTLVLTDKPAPIRVSARAVASPASTPRAVSAPTRAAAPRVVANGPGLGGGERLAGGRTLTPPATEPGNKVAPALPADPLKDVRPATDPIIDTISNPATTAGQVADGAQSVTDAAGVGLARISPQVGSAVAGAGQTAADSIRQLPLPQHVLPEH
ncbi:MAG: hypothetical protein ACJ77Z_19965, partial [Thermoleophilaceae bacterium]